MSIFQFGTLVEGIPYKVLDEREVRANSGIMLLIGSIASINGFIFQRYAILPYLIGFLAINFALCVVNPRLSPIFQLGRLLTRKQSPLYIGAVQKRFAWSLGTILSLTIFLLTFPLQMDASLFEPVCGLCMICLLLLYFESTFGICVGCKIYYGAMKIGLIKKPAVKPNCMGDSCIIQN